MIVIPRVAQRLWLVSVLDYVRGNTPGPNPLLMLNLYRNDYSPNANTVLGDFLPATFAGYAARAIGGLFPFPITNPDGLAQSNSGNVIWVPTDRETIETVHGWWMTLQSDTVPPVLFACERMVPGVQVQLPDVNVCVNVGLTLGSRFS